MYLYIQAQEFLELILLEFLLSVHDIWVLLKFNTSSFYFSEKANDSTFEFVKVACF